MTADSAMDELKVGLPPVAPSDARLFVLGSLPGDASLAAGRYYAHPQNQFWRLLGSVIGADLQTLSYEARVQRLSDHGIGLWDVIAAASRRGSLDQSIRSPGHNRIDTLVEHYPRLEAIAFNGGTAAMIGRRLLAADARVALIDLPSSSPANTRPFAEKVAAWSQLAEFCGPPLVRAPNPADMAHDDSAKLRRNR